MKLTERLHKAYSYKLTLEQIDAFVARNSGMYIASETHNEPLQDDGSVLLVEAANKVYLYLTARPVPQRWPVMSRDEARAAGLKRYWTGSLCVRGHVSQRYTSSGACVECCMENMAAAAERRVRRDVYGLVEHTVHVHQDDVDKLEAYATALRLERGMTG